MGQRQTLFLVMRKTLEEKSEQLKKAPEPGSGQAPAKPVAMQGGGVVPVWTQQRHCACYAAPGEFVMSRGAVQQYTDTLAGMNAMGGTNRPMITNNVMYASGGGQVPDKEDPVPETRQQKNLVEELVHSSLV